MYTYIYLYIYLYIYICTYTDLIIYTYINNIYIYISVCTFVFLRSPPYPPTLEVTIMDTKRELDCQKRWVAKHVPR